MDIGPKELGYRTSRDDPSRSVYRIVRKHWHPLEDDPRTGNYHVRNQLPIAQLIAEPHQSIGYNLDALVINKDIVVGTPLGMNNFAWINSRSPYYDEGKYLCNGE